MQRFGTLFVVMMMLYGCDPGETIFIRDSDGGVISCPEQQSMVVRFSGEFAIGTSGETYREENEQKRWSYERDKDVGVGLIAGTVDSKRLKWFRIDLFCGESRDVLYATRKITPGDLRRIDPYSFEYRVARPVY